MLTFINVTCASAHMQINHAWLLKIQFYFICSSCLQRMERIRLKEQYHAFRDKMGVLMYVIGAALSLGLHNAQKRSRANEAFSLTPPFMVGVQMFLCWMLYLYTALALRENVLKVSRPVHLSWMLDCTWLWLCRNLLSRQARLCMSGTRRSKVASSPPAQVQASCMLSCQLHMQMLPDRCIGSAGNAAIVEPG